jgi:hypothetical protein
VCVWSCVVVCLVLTRCCYIGRKSSGRKVAVQRRFTSTEHTCAELLSGMEDSAFVGGSHGTVKSDVMDRVGWRGGVRCSNGGALATTLELRSWEYASWSVDVLVVALGGVWRWVWCDFTNHVVGQLLYGTARRCGCGVGGGVGAGSGWGRECLRVVMSPRTSAKRRNGGWGRSCVVCLLP